MKGRAWFWSVLIGVFILIVVVIGYPVRANSHPSAKWFAEERLRQAAAWAPVERAMTSGRVADVRRAFAKYKLTGNPTGETLLSEVARFYLAKGDRADAKALLDPIVHHRPGIADGDIDPRTVFLWFEADPSASEQERNAVVENWNAGFRRHMGFGSSLSDLGQRALLEYEEGETFLTNGPSPQAAVHYRNAYRMAPGSREVKEKMFYALGVHEDSGALADRRAALAAARGSDREFDEYLTRRLAILQ